MPYTQVSFTVSPPDPWRDVLSAELGEIGFDSFEEGVVDPKRSTGVLLAYIRSDRFREALLHELSTVRDPMVSVEWNSVEIADRNWNAEWESSFQPVEVDGIVR
ncbi:MAG TPA: hypothetical protein PK760_06740, partial [Flavobacteriales bacterium]|nr:hypothetical protein [Flavobacteriales bacterium]